MSQNEKIVQIDEISKSFGHFTALKNVSLQIPRGSFTTLLGPSGCGKTTLMRLIAGFYEPDEGSITIEGKKMNGVPTFKRNTPLVFQEYALFPHMTVFENISYGLKIQKKRKKEIEEQVRNMISMFDLDGLAQRYPRQLSGGQQQRVAFARALVLEQNLLLMDEPLSNLDAKMRVEVRNELRSLQQRLGFTAIFVTHDQDEAMAISDQIAVFNKGEICQVGTPWEIYYTPTSRFVADFVGLTNFVTGVVRAIDDEYIVVMADSKPLHIKNHQSTVKIGDQVELIIRPECITIVSQNECDRNQKNIFTGSILQSHFHGSLIRYEVMSLEQNWTIDVMKPGLVGVLSGFITFVVDAEMIHMIPKE